MTRQLNPHSGNRDMANPEASIRPYADGDFDAVAALWQASGLTVPYNDPAADIAFCRTSPNAELFVTEIGGAIVASAMAGHDGHRGWLYYVAVDPAHRGASLARAIVRHGEAWLAGLGVRKVNLQIRESNTAVQGFYERIGYVNEPRINMSRWLVDSPQASD